MRVISVAAALIWLTASGCGGKSSTRSDGGTRDADTSDAATDASLADASLSDAAQPDTGTDARVDAGKPAPTCGDLDAPGTWERLGAGFDRVHVRAPQDPTIALTSDDTPIVAYREGAPWDIYVRRWTGTDWELLGGALSARSGVTTSTGSPALVIDSLDRPVVAWSEQDGMTWHLHARRYEDGAWVELGAPFRATPADGQIFGEVSLARDATDRLYAASIEDELTSTSGYDGAHVFVFNPPNWDPVGGRIRAAAGDGVTSIDLEVAPDGTPHLAYAQNALTGARTHVVRWSGSTWETLGGDLGLDATSLPQLAHESTNAPIVAFNESVVPTGLMSEVRLHRWNGTTWDALGDLGPGLVDLAVDPRDQPVVAIVEGVMRREGATWTPLSDRMTQRWAPVSLALSSCGDPFVAFHDGPLDIHVTRYVREEAP